MYYKHKLRQETINWCFQLTIEVEDNAQPKQTATCQVVVTIIRNAYGPIFSNNYYNTTIVEYMAIQSSVLQISATDRDPSSVRYLHLNSIMKIKCAEI